MLRTCLLSEKNYQQFLVTINKIVVWALRFEPLLPHVHYSMAKSYDQPKLSWIVAYLFRLWRFIPVKTAELVFYFSPVVLISEAFDAWQFQFNSTCVPVNGIREE